MNVLFLNKHGGLGGGEIALMDHAFHLHRNGRNVKVLLRQPGALVDRLKTEGIDCRVGWAPRLGYRVQHMWWRSQLQKIVAKPSHDLIWVYTLDDLLLLGRQCVTGKVVCFRSQGEVYASLREDEANVKCLDVLMACHKVVCTTRYEYEYLLAKQLVHQERLSYIPIGVDCLRYGNLPTDTSSRPVIGMFGRLVPWKGHDVFLRALHAIRDFEWDAIIVGDATYGRESDAARLKNMAQEMAIDSRIRWVGFQSNVEDWFRQCSIVVHCSRKEPFGMVIAEAMATGRCVVASNVEGPREMISPGDTGILCEPGDVSALAGELRYLLQHSELRESIGQKAAQVIRKRFDAGKSMVELASLS